ncbi:MAG: hypothetical protein SV966_03165 [Actinomycetota bacterium]|nr:hypothetical protein [Actinomycetota bacterium]
MVPLPMVLKASVTTFSLTVPTVTIAGDPVRRHADRLSGMQAVGHCENGHLGPLSVCVVTLGSDHHGFAKRTATVQQSHSHVAEGTLTSRDPPLPKPKLVLAGRATTLSTNQV